MSTPARRRSLAGPLSSGAVCFLAGLMMATAASSSAGGHENRTDPTLRELVQQAADRNTELRATTQRLRQEVDELTAALGGNPELSQGVAAAQRNALANAVVGPGLRVVLTDAPLNVQPAGVSDDVLLVHQQDIQSVVNAMWAGGAEAMTIQGQRVISTTGIKCVGNSVVLHGVPYAPPYVIEAIGPVDGMERALNASPAVTIYRQYADAYGLGYTVEKPGESERPAFQGALGVRVAEPER